MKLRSRVSAVLGREHRASHWTVDGVRYNDHAAALIASSALSHHDGRAHVPAEVINVRRRPA